MVINNKLLAFLKAVVVSCTITYFMNLDAIYGIVFVILLCGCTSLFFYSSKKKFEKYNSYVLSVACSICVIIGLAFSLSNNFHYLINHPFISFFIFISTLLSLNAIAKVSLYYLHRVDMFNDVPISRYTKFILIILVGWIIYLIPFFPGNVAGDGNTQLDMYFKVSNYPLTNHHPVISTLFEGGIVNLGRHLGFSDNIALFIYIVFSVLICACIYAYCINKFSERGLNRKISYSIALIVGFLPYWSLVSEALHKDGLFIAFFAWFYIELIFIYIDQSENADIKISQFIKLILAAMLVSFWRNNGFIDIIIPLMVMSGIIFKKQGKKLILLTALVAVVYIGFQKVVLPIAGVQPSEKIEMLSIPTQQTARYIKYYPNDLSSEEKRILKNTFVDYEDLGHNYVPVWSDPVKGAMKSNANASEYFKVWLSMGLKHPIVYVESFLNGTYLYYSPQFKGTSFTWVTSYGIANYDKKYNLNFHQVISQSFRTKVNKAINLFGDVPFISALMNDAIYFWVSIFVLGSFIKKHRYTVIVCYLPILLNFLVCLASPVNGSNRYSGCIIFPVILLVLMANYLLSVRSKEKKTNKEWTGELHG